MQTTKPRTHPRTDDCLSATVRTDCEANQGVGGRTGRWDLRNALLGFALAPFRVHHYRDVHSRMLRDALCTLDCCADGSFE